MIELPRAVSNPWRDCNTTEVRDGGAGCAGPPKRTRSCGGTYGLAAKTITCESARNNAAFVTAAATRRSLRQAAIAKYGTEASQNSKPKYQRIPATAYSTMSINSNGGRQRAGEGRPIHASCHIVQAATNAATAKMKNGSFSGCTDQMITAGAKLRAAMAMTAGVANSPFSLRPSRRIAAHAPRYAKRFNSAPTDAASPKRSWKTA